MDNKNQNQNTGQGKSEDEAIRTMHADLAKLREEAEGKGELPKKEKIEKKEVTKKVPTRPGVAPVATPSVPTRPAPIMSKQQPTTPSVPPRPMFKRPQVTTAPGMPSLVKKEVKPPSMAIPPRPGAPATPLKPQQAEKPRLDMPQKPNWAQRPEASTSPQLKKRLAVGTMKPGERPKMSAEEKAKLESLIKGDVVGAPQTVLPKKEMAVPKPKMEERLRPLPKPSIEGTLVERLSKEVPRKEIPQREISKAPVVPRIPTPPKPPVLEKEEKGMEEVPLKQESTKRTWILVGAISLAVVLIGAGIATYFLIFKGKEEETIVEVKKQPEQVQETTSSKEVAKEEVTPAEITPIEEKEEVSPSVTPQEEEIEKAEVTPEPTPIIEPPKEEVKVEAPKPTVETAKVAVEEEKVEVVAKKTAVTGANEDELAGTGFEHNILWIILSLIVAFVGGIIYRLKSRKVKIKIQ